MVFFRDDFQLEAVAYNKVGGVVRQRVIDFTTMSGFNTLKSHLEKSLAKTALLKQIRCYKYNEQELRWGGGNLLEQMQKKKGLTT